MTSKLRTPGLYEFLQEAELQHYYNGLKNILQVHNVGQLKYVHEDDLYNIGMSKPECRRLKTFFYKYCPGNYASKLRRLLRPGALTGRREDARAGEYLLGEEGGVGMEIGTRGTIKVPSQHVIPADAISIYKELGQGEFGVVQQGVWTDHDGMRHQVAVKCLSKERMQNNTLEFMKEYEIMQSIDHNNIVRLYGVILDAAQIMLITELAPLRSLLECLKEQSLRTTFTVQCLADFCLQICQGMAYIESKRLIHRDLAARNILVFSKNTVKISDFGLSRALGVGKDYYQTNFNVNLKLPIAWCAPECINYLKFTSASDVWAFGVTMWEMFSYGFQPWAALTGHQILEAIDEQAGQRLEQPVHCPRDHYQVMESCWAHHPANRPTFSQLQAMLEDARPEQVQVVVARGGGRDGGQLDYQVGDVITVLDKHNVSGGGNNWTGVNGQGRVGRFVPTHTVAYLDTMPSTGTWGRGTLGHQHEEEEEHQGVFQRAGLRGSKDRQGSRRKISRDMISAPRGQVQHTGHVGHDGCYFGDVGFISGTNGHLQIGGAGGGSSRASTGTRLPSSGSENGFPSLSRADSDVSESAPLLATGAGSTASSAAHVALAPVRMGHTIGYLRHKAPSGSQEEAATTSRQEYHQYQSISDEETFGPPLDLGPSLMDEVFGELDSTRDEDEPDAPTADDVGKVGSSGGGGNIVEKLADKVSTMTMSRRHKGKKAAVVKPIKPSDEKTLEQAIAMANMLASKSMHDLDKRCVDDIFPSPQISPLTPNSPNKKFTFRFPGHGKARSTSPRHFSDEANSHNDMESTLTPTARDAYKILIEGDKEAESPAAAVAAAPVVSKPSHSHRFSLPPSCHVFSGTSTPYSLDNMAVVTPTPATTSTTTNSSDNPLPLPPKDRKVSVTSGRRHVRKNPLIIPSGAAASMARKAEVDNTEDTDLPNGRKQTHELQMKESALQQRRDRTVQLRNRALNRDDRGHNRVATNDAFEEEIACSIDALDNIPESKYNSPKTSLEHENAPSQQQLTQEQPQNHENHQYGYTQDNKTQQYQSPKNQQEHDNQQYGYNQDHVSCEDLLDFSPRSDSDEVRIMGKVLGGAGGNNSTYTAALDASQWNVHRAIKLVKLRTLVQIPGVTDYEMKMALQSREWDVTKAANDINKKLRG